MDKTRIMDYQNLVCTVPVSDTVIDYAVSLVTKTEPLASSEKIVKDFITWERAPELRSI